MADVRTYDVGGSFIEDLGKTVLPASIKPFDFSALDKAMETESEISTKALEIAQENVKNLGKIKDELTQLTTPSLFHAAELESVKKSIGLDEKVFAQAANNIDDATAMFEVDRKMKKLSADPRVKEIMYNNALLEAAKLTLPTIEDPALRALAIKDIDAATKNATDPNAIKNLNMAQYKTVDVEEAYIKALDKFAPYTPVTEQFVGDDGKTYTRTVHKRDPEMVAKTRKYFMDNPVAKNNLIAKGYIDEKGDPVKPQDGTSWFDDIEAPQLVPIEEISGGSGKGSSSSSDGSVSGDTSYTPSEGLQPITSEPAIVKDEDTGYEFDLGIISDVETSGRSEKDLVHVDPGTLKNSAGQDIRALNIGGFSFNGKTGEAFLESIEIPDDNLNPAAVSALEALKKISLTGVGAKDKEEMVQRLYVQLDRALGGDTLKEMEKQYAVKNFGVTAINYLKSLKGMEDTDFSVGDSTLIMDTAIQFGTDTWKEFMRSYAAHVRDGGELSLKEFITKKRIAFYNKKYGASEAQAYKDRAWKVYDAATRMDDGDDRTAVASSGGQKENGGFYADAGSYSKYTTGNVAAEIDQNAVAKADKWESPTQTTQ